MAGGVLKTLGVLSIVVGALAIVVGLAAAAFGASTYGNEASKEDRSLFSSGPNRDRQEAGMMAAIGGVGMAGVGLVIVILGIVLVVWGASRAKRALVDSLRAPGSGERVP